MKISTNIDLLGSELSKSKIEELSTALCKPFNDGIQNALETDLKLKFIEETVKKAREKLNPFVLNSILVDEINGCKVSKRNGYAILDFEQDAEYAMLKKQLDERKALLSQSFKTVHNVVTEQGEVVPKLPVKSYTSDSISYTFKK